MMAIMHKGRENGTIQSNVNKKERADHGASQNQPRNRTSAKKNGPSQGPEAPSVTLLVVLLSQASQHEFNLKPHRRIENGIVLSGRTPLPQANSTRPRRARGAQRRALCANFARWHGSGVRGER